MKLKKEVPCLQRGFVYSLTHRSVPLRLISPGTECLGGWAADLLKLWSELLLIEESLCPERLSNSPKVTQFIIS